jgi:hypothetical protein
MSLCEEGPPEAAANAAAAAAAVAAAILAAVEGGILPPGIAPRLVVPKKPAGRREKDVLSARRDARLHGRRGRLPRFSEGKLP